MSVKALQRDKNRAGVLSVPLFDERIVAAAIDFANASPATDEDVDRLMQPLRAVVLGPERSKTYRIGVIDWKDAQAWLLKMLPEVRAFSAKGTSESSRDRTRAEVTAMLRAYFFGYQLKVGRNRLELDVSWAVWTVPAVCAVAIFNFVVPGGIPSARLGKCQYRNCGKWFLRPPPKRGHLDDYCLGTNHGSSERVMRMRDKLAAAKPK